MDGALRWVTVACIFIAALAVAGAIAALIGSRLPQSHRVTRERVLQTTPDLLWTTLVDVEAYPAWRTDVAGIRRLPDREGRPAWVEQGRSGTMAFTFERMEAPRLLVSRITDPALPFGGTWTFQIAPAAEGVRLTVTEDGEVYNPLFRFMARFIFGYDGTINAYLSALGRRFHEGHAVARR